MIKNFLKRLWFRMMAWLHNGYAICGMCGSGIYNANELDEWERHSTVCPGQNVRLHVVSMEDFLRQRETGLVRLSFEDYLAQQAEHEGKHRP